MSVGVNIRIPEFRQPPGADVPVGDVGRLAGYLAAHRRVLVITGAGCSTGSGIPAYRDGQGRWTRAQPIQYRAFLEQAAMRQRYWARSYLGWPRVASARPSTAHHSLAALERRGRLSAIVTQNVDGLHQRAGSRTVVELHGSLSEVICLQCRERSDRDGVQANLQRLNPDWSADVDGVNPDGDARLADSACAGFRIAACRHCGGIIKPDVVFFGEGVPGARVERVHRLLAGSDAVLVVGSSLVVWSAYRFIRKAAAMGLPIAAVNDGRTRADPLLAFKVPGDCDEVLDAVVDQLDPL